MDALAVFAFTWALVCWFTNTNPITEAIAIVRELSRDTWNLVRRKAS